jgi:FkbM family methyltransferase
VIVGHYSKLAQPIERLNPITFLKKPEYLLRPSQTLRRLARIGKPTPRQATVRLPWGATVEVQTGENVGSDIYHYGIFDKIVPEAIWRLLDSGETAFDVGANIGQNSSVMAQRVGKSGIVHAFEPHPRTFAQLKNNRAGWTAPQSGVVQLHNLGLGPKPATAFLYTESPFLSGSALHEQSAADKEQIQVAVQPLDAFATGKIGVCKIDVEGHELAVLQGAEQTLNRQGIRDIVFEDFNPKPSPVTTFLEQHGFTLFELHDTWRKPRLVPLHITAFPTHPGFSSNYLATLEPDRAVQRFQMAGWRCLVAR